MSCAQDKQPSQSSRRSFVKAGVAASATLGAALQSRMVHAAGDDKLRVGLVGCGGRGSGAAQNAMKADPNVNIVALGDLYEAPLQRCRQVLSSGDQAKQLQVDDAHCFAGLDSYKKVLASDIDVVLLASPPYYRPEHFEAAVAAGMQIFCEKPVATDVVGVKRVEAACKEAEGKGLNVVSGLCWRYHTGMIDMVKRVHEGQIGDVVSIQSNYLTSPVWQKTRESGESEMQYQMRNWMNYIWLSGDHIVEQFIHSLDKALWINHDVPPVMAYGLGGRQNRNDETEGNIYDHFSVVYEWENGRRCFAHTRQMTNCFNQTEDFIFGSDGTAILCAGEIKGKNPFKYTEDVVQMHQAEHDEFFKAIKGNRARINNGDYMCKSTMMAILGREACYTGKKLTYEQLRNSDLDLGPKSFDAGDAPKAIVPRPGEYELRG